MDRKELEIKLVALGVKSRHFSLYGQLIADAIIMDEVYGRWVVFYYDERGNRDLEKEFRSETEACEYVFYLLKDDAAAKK